MLEPVRTKQETNKIKKMINLLILCAEMVGITHFLGTC
jgi:hypothetical protein